MFTFIVITTRKPDIEVDVAMNKDVIQFIQVMLGNKMVGKDGKGLLAAKTTPAANKDKGSKKTPTSRSSRAGLQFPIGHIHCQLKNKNFSSWTCWCHNKVYTAVILEYLTAKVFELAGYDS